MNRFTLNDFAGKVPKELSSFLDTATRPLIIVTGPTGSGKTNFSLQLTQSIEEMFVSRGEPERRVEILNADSRQCYKDLDIGTAKITAKEMQDIPHYFINVLDPTEEATIAWYQKEATKVLEDIHTRGRIPMMVGGSMLYISAVIDALKPLESDPALREKIEQAYDVDEGRTLYRMLQEVDPDSAASFQRENKVYVVRALEIYEMTGRPASLVKEKGTTPYDLFILALDVPRDVLTDRINARTKHMLDNGWIEEVETLLKKGFTKKDPGLKSHGYREIVEWIESRKKDRTALEEDISAKVRQYAKRQMTWWRNDERVHWVSM